VVKKTVPYSVIISKTKAIIQNTEYSFFEERKLEKKIVV